MSVHPTLSVPTRAQKSSHAALSCLRAFTSVPTSSRSARIEAVIVPASRGAAALDGAATLATRLNATLVALCSQQTLGHQVAARFAAMPRCRVVAIDVPTDYWHDLLPTRTVAPRFRAASRHRQTDLSLKRNLGLILARLQSWGRILFLDDDIGETIDGKVTGLPVQTAHNLAAALNSHQIAGLACREFPDNSVVCHARRLAGFEQDTFVSGAALAVNCDDHPMPFFPDLYNEDWFFFSRRVASREIAYVGDATQAAYDPFGSPNRAREEEFGDLLAEGMFALFAEQTAEMTYLDRLAAADTSYWTQFIDARRDTLSLIGLELEIALESGVRGYSQLIAALHSLDAASDQLRLLSPELCVDFLDAWTADLLEWERTTQRIRPVNDIPEAMNFLRVSGGITGAAWT
jgi:hypothetical protein